MPGEQNLGGAVYTIRTDTAQFERGMKEAEEHAKQLGKSVEQSGRSGAMGLLYMSQAIDDVQYGFSAIVNNIPQIAMAFGGGAGIAGAAGIAAVAISQLSKHWDEFFGKAHGDVTKLSDNLDRVPAQIKKIEQAISEIEKKQEDTPILPLMEEERLIGLKRMREEGKERLSDEALIKGVQDEKILKNAAAIRDAMGKVGGAESVQDFMVQQGMSPNEARKTVAGALRGNTGYLDDILERIPEAALGRFMPLFGATSERRKQDEEDKEEGKRMEAQAKRRKEDNQQAEQLNRQGQEGERRLKLDMLGDRREELELQKRKEMAMLSPSGRRQLENELLGVQPFEAAKVGDPQSMIKSAMQETLGRNKNQEDQIAQLKSIDKELKEINKNTKTMNRYE